MKKICISIVNYNGNEQTAECLASIEKLTVSGFDVHVIVVDNGSKKPFEVEPRKFMNFSLKILKNENTGFSGGHNLAIAKALDSEFDYILILNNDTILDKKLLSELITGLESEEKIGVAVPKIYFAKGHEFHHDLYDKDDLGNVIWYAGGEMDWNNIVGKHRGVDEVDNGQYDKVEKTEFFTGCCALFKREVFEKIGIFDERYFLYFEDADLSVRLKKKGFAILYYPTAKLWHINAGSTGGSGSRLQDYYLTRNRLLFGFSYADKKTQFALFRESIRLLLSGREEQKRGVRDYFVRKFGKGSYTV